MKRRALLVSATAAGVTVMAGAAGAAAAAYPQNRAPLQPAAFLRLRPGAVRAQGWLATQLSYQLDGLCGRYASLSHFLQYNNTGWTNPSLGGWEEVPYWLRGYVDLAYVTGDSTALSAANQWMNGVIATQAADGYFGPQALRTSLNGHADLWPHMPMLHAIRSHAEYTGDSRVNGFLTRFFGFMNAQPLGVFRDGWGTWRWGDTIDVVYWLYNRTGDAFLLDLVRKIHANSANWINNLPTLHNVNVTQGFREPAQYWVLSGNAGDRAAAYNDYSMVQSAFGQFPGGGFAGDENARSGFTDPRQGFETCGIAEYMLSHEILTRITGDPVWADRTEELAFNLLPAALDPRGKSLHYITSANSIDLDNSVKTQAQYQNGFAMQSYRPGVDQYRCCPHNYGMAWPYFVEEMWLATPDGGLCAALYGPSTVSALVSGGVPVALTESTAYPFGETVTISVSGLPSATAFPLVLRIPAWCTSPSVNGTPVTGGFARLDRTWVNGDTVVLRLPMTVSRKTWPSQHNGMSVHYGPLAFSVKIEEQWVQTGGSAQFPEYDVHATTPWNYGLVPGAAITVAMAGNVNDPFAPANAPIVLGTSAQRIPAWQADSQHVVTPLQEGPVATNTATEQVTLIPMGAARLRITSFPQTGGTRSWQVLGAPFRLRNRNSGKVLGVSGMSLGNSANVVQFSDNGTADHLWRFVDAGNGYVKVVNLNSGKLLAVENMSLADSARVQQYEDSGTADHLWQILDNGSYLKLRNANSGKVVGVSGMSTADSAQVVQYADNGTADHDWVLIPDGEIRIANVNSGKLLAVENMSLADSARVQQYSDNGTADHLWVFLPDAGGYFRIRNVHSGKVLGVSGMSTADSAQVVQFADNGTADHLWRLRLDTGGAGTMRIQNLNSGKVLAVHNMSMADSANVEQFSDNGTLDHSWRLL